MKMPTSASPKDAVNHLLQNIKAIEDKLDPGTGSNIIKRIGQRALNWPFTKKEVDEWVAKFETEVDSQSRFQY